MGLTVEIIGYIARGVSGSESPNWTLGPYIIQAIFLLVAPALFAASIYMEFGRIVTGLQAEHHTFMRITWITKIFVTGDVISFLLQGGGGGYQSSGTAEALSTGTDIIIVGLFVQLLFFGFFIGVAGAWHYRMLCLPPSRAYFLPWKKHVYTLFGTSMLIMVRSVFRVIEYLQGNNGYILSREAFLYVFDAMLMLAVMATLHFVHPSEVLSFLKKRQEGRDTLDLQLEGNYQAI
ncbi:hypothetical protein NU219Hw_g8533t2 [Hortaea werneckii]